MECKARVKKNTRYCRDEDRTVVGVVAVMVRAVWATNDREELDALILNRAKYALLYANCKSEYGYSRNKD
jgi:hypothetical protein